MFCGDGSGRQLLPILHAVCLRCILRRSRRQKTGAEQEEAGGTAGGTAGQARRWRRRAEPRRAHRTASARTRLPAPRAVRWRLAKRFCPALTFCALSAALPLICVPGRGRARFDLMSLFSASAAVVNHRHGAGDMWLRFAGCGLFRWAAAAAAMREGLAAIFKALPGSGARARRK